MIYQQADFFRIPLLDGSDAVGQVFEVDATANKAVFCGLTSRIAANSKPIAPLTPQDIIAFCLIDPAHLANSTWPISGFDQIPKFDPYFDLSRHKTNGFADLEIHEPAVIEAFMNAWHGHYPWTAFGRLFDQLNSNGINRERPRT